PKPNTLTPKEAADGWLLLFDGETTFGWDIDGPAKVDDGTLVIGGDKEAKASLTTRFGPEFEIRFEYKSEGKQAEVTFQAGAAHVTYSGLLNTGKWYSYKAQVAHVGGQRTVDTTHVPVGRGTPDQSGSTSVKSPPLPLAIRFDVPAGG